MGRKDFISNSLYGMRDHIKEMQQQLSSGNNQERLEDEQVVAAGKEQPPETEPPQLKNLQATATPELFQVEKATEVDAVKNIRQEVPAVENKRAYSAALPEKRRDEIFKLHQDLKSKVARQLAESEFTVSNYNEAINSLMAYSKYLAGTMRKLEKFNNSDEYDLLTFKELENIRLELICRSVEADKIRSNCGSGNVAVSDGNGRTSDFDLKSLPVGFIVKCGFLAALPLILTIVVCSLVLAVVLLVGYGIIN